MKILKVNGNGDAYQSWNRDQANAVQYRILAEKPVGERAPVSAEATISVGAFSLAAAGNFPALARDLSPNGFKAVVDYGYGTTAFVMPNLLSKLGTEVLAPDTTVWVKDFAHHMGDPIQDYYYWHPGYDDPVRHIGGGAPPELLDRLRAEGCREVQGYFFSPARPASEIAGLLTSVADKSRRERPVAPIGQGRQRETAHVKLVG